MIQNTYGAADNADDYSQVVFTPAAVLDLLTQIEELADQSISLTQTLDGKIQISIGSSDYIIESAPTDIEVDDEVVETIDDENESAYIELVESGQADYMDNGEPVEGGMLKDTAKALLLGGLIRFAGKHLLK